MCSGAVAENYVLHLRVGAHVMFHRLYGMYPCHFLTFLRSVYGRPENAKIFKDVILVRFIVRLVQVLSCYCLSDH